jgi:hypothetical protein
VIHPCHETTTVLLKRKDPACREAKPGLEL